MILVLRKAIIKFSRITERFDFGPTFYQLSKYIHRIVKMKTKTKNPRVKWGKTELGKYAMSKKTHSKGNRGTEWG